MVSAMRLDPFHQNMADISFEEAVQLSIRRDPRYQAELERAWTAMRARF